jgi:hypothetical protein
MTISGNDHGFSAGLKGELIDLSSVGLIIRALIQDNVVVVINNADDFITTSF